MKKVKYAVIHQVISALHSVVCIPKGFWKEEAEPVQGDIIELEYNSKNEGDMWFDQPSQWKIEGPVWKIEGPLEAGCVSFFKTLWPFYDWIKFDDTLYCFKASLLKPKFTYTELANKVAENMEQRFGSKKC